MSDEKIFTVRKPLPAAYLQNKANSPNHFISPNEDADLTLSSVAKVETIPPPKSKTTPKPAPKPKPKKEERLPPQPDDPTREYRYPKWVQYLYMNECCWFTYLFWLAILVFVIIYGFLFITTFNWRSPKTSN